jgi:hypothetical protein
MVAECLETMVVPIDRFRDVREVLAVRLHGNPFLAGVPPQADARGRHDAISVPDRGRTRFSRRNA